MADILYTYKNEVYVNLTNKCDCSCTFCIRSHKDGVGDADTLWHKKDPALEEVTAAMDAFDFAGYQELVYCGYGEPTCALENLVASAKYAKEKYGIKVRINTNGLGNLYNGKDIVPESNSCELYFEEKNIEAFVEKLEKNYPSLKYANRLMTHSWGQKVIRFYDPDGNLIEVGTPLHN